MWLLWKMSCWSKRWLALVRPCMIRKSMPNKPNLLRITPLWEWTSPWREKLWFVGSVTRKATSLTNARRRSGRSKRKSEQAKSPTPVSTRWTKRWLHHIWSRRKKWQGDSHQGQQRKESQTHLGAKGDYLNHEKHQEGLGPEREMRSSNDFEEFGDLANFLMYIMGCITLDQE